jgi:hypothetical protein
MADNNRDIMYAKLDPVYGVTYDHKLADMEGAWWVSKGYEPCGPGDKCSWYIAAGAGVTGLTYYGDVEWYYWTNIGP